MKEEIYTKISLYGFLFFIFILGVLTSQLKAFKLKRWFRILMYFLSIIPVLFGSLLVISIEGSPELAFGDFSGEFQGRLWQMGSMVFYIGTITSKSNKTDKSKYLRYLVGVMAVIGAVLQMAFNSEYSMDIDNILMKISYGIRPIILLCFAFTLFFPRIFQKWINK